MDAQIVLSDDLLKAFCQFKRGEACDTRLITRLLTFYKPHLTCVNQLKRIDNKDSVLLQSLAASGWIGQSIEELAERSSLKLILTTNQSDYPYVNIAGGDAIEPNYTGTFKNEPRIKAIAHLKALCQSARSIYIYDPFLKGYQERATPTIMDGIFSLLPMSSFTLYCDDGAFMQHTKSDWKRRNSELTFKKAENSPWKKHDRYLIIDRKVEVILSSGFDYLFDTNGDFTYVVRLLK